MQQLETLSAGRLLEPALFAAFAAVDTDEARADLDAEQRRLLDEVLRDFRRGGVERWAATRTDGGNAQQATPDAATATGSPRQPSAAAA